MANETRDVLLHYCTQLTACSGTTWVSHHQKGKTSLDVNEARDNGVLGCSGISWTICKQLLQADNHTSTSLLSFYRPDAFLEAQLTVCAKTCMHRTETPKPIWIKFFLVLDIPNIITYTNFGDRRLKGFWVAGVSNFPLSHRLSSSPLQHSRTTMPVCD